MAAQQQSHNLADSTEEVAKKVRAVVARSLELQPDDVQMESSLFELGAESLDLLDMAFLLEQEYKIQFPRTDIIERAAQYFGEEALVTGGVVTDLGLRLLRRGMPELDPEVIKPGLKAIDVAKMITVGSFVRITLRLLEAKVDFPRACSKCGGELVESNVMPELQCAGCGEIVPLPSGDDILLRDLIALFEATKVEP